MNRFVNRSARNALLLSVAAALTGCLDEAVDTAAVEDDLAVAAKADGIALSQSLTAPIAAAAGCSTNLVPSMTSAVLPAGVVTRSGAYGSTYEAWKAFDASDSSMWISAVNRTPAWIGY